MSNKTVTSIVDLQEYSKGAIVELPPFAEGQPFVARLVRPSMIALLRSGKIPNKLMNTANDLFVKGQQSFVEKVDDSAQMEELFEVIDTLCEATLAEPTMQQLREAGVQLCDDQQMFILNYAERGVEALKDFRTE